MDRDEESVYEEMPCEGLTVFFGCRLSWAAMAELWDHAFENDDHDGLDIDRLSELTDALLLPESLRLTCYIVSNDGVVHDEAKDCHFFLTSRHVHTFSDVASFDYSGFRRDYLNTTKRIAETCSNEANAFCHHKPPPSPPQPRPRLLPTLSGGGAWSLPCPRLFVV